MKVADYRSEILIYLLNPDYTQAQAQTGVMTSVGYQARFYPTVDLFFQACNTEPPHLVLIDADVFNDDIEDFYHQIKNVSEEILICLFTSTKNMLNTLQFISQGFAYDYIMTPMVSSLDLIQKLDRATELLLIGYENEELLEELEGKNFKEVVESIASTEIEPQEASAEIEPEQELDYDPVFEFLQEVKLIRDKDIIIQRYMEKLSTSLNMTPIIFLKYLPNQLALGLKHSVFVPNINLQGIGLQLRGVPPNLIPRHLENPNELPQLHAMMKKVFNKESFFSTPFRMDDKVLGIFVIFDLMKEKYQRSKMFYMLDILELAYRSSELELRNHQLEIYDMNTKLINRRHFMDRLEEEMDRARRTSHPLAVIIIDLDNQKRLFEQLGEKSFEVLMAQVGKVLRKTNRVNDIVSRFHSSLFAILLPHTPSMGAAVKAEKIRRILESHQFSVLQNTEFENLSFSFGVNEFPSLASDSDALIRGADEAVEQVKVAGGNRVCLATPPPGFEPEYQPIQVEDRFKE